MKFSAKFAFSYQIIGSVLRQPRYWRWFVLAWLVILSLFLWLRNINLFVYIVTQSPLGLAGKLEFVLDVYGNFLVNLLNPLAFTTLILSLLAAVQVTLLVYLLHQAGAYAKVGGKGGAGALVAVAGSHCLSCGGSLFAPVLSALVGSGTYFSAARISLAQTVGVMANVIGIALMVYSVAAVAKRIQMGVVTR